MRDMMQIGAKKPYSVKKEKREAAAETNLWLSIALSLVRFSYPSVSRCSGQYVEAKNPISHFDLCMLILHICKEKDRQIPSACKQLDCDLYYDFLETDSVFE